MDSPLIGDHWDYPGLVVSSEDVVRASRALHSVVVNVGWLGKETPVHYSKGDPPWEEQSLWWAGSLEDFLVAFHWWLPAGFVIAKDSSGFYTCCILRPSITERNQCIYYRNSRSHRRRQIDGVLIVIEQCYGLKVHWMMWFDSIWAPRL